uniref:Metalloendopeptidase n=1 Tax=Nothobranchius furzeri TaxID=105023 RepID=A0A8C6Q6Q7_NOTFU
MFWRASQDQRGSTLVSFLSYTSYNILHFYCNSVFRKMKRKRFFVFPSDEIPDFDDMTAMDQILVVNSSKFSQTDADRGLSFREGDIAYSYARSAINCPDNTCLWPKSIDGFVYVPYILSPLYGISFLRCFEDGLESLGVPIKKPGCRTFLCWSFLGQTGGSQVLSLQSPGCMWAGIAAHEFMHALGFVHEQSRSDRDHYVTIVWKNIMPEHIHNFRKQATNNLNSPYDYSSVMHYGRYAFSEDGGPTIIPRPDPYIPIGQRDGPSALDLHKINTLYDCDLKKILYFPVDMPNHHTCM